MCLEASSSFLTKQTDVTYVLNIPPHRLKVPKACRFKAEDGVLKYFGLTFKVKQGLFCQDSAAVNLCSRESATLHANANAARAHFGDILGMISINGQIVEVWIGSALTMRQEASEPRAAGSWGGVKLL